LLRLLASGQECRSERGENVDEQQGHCKTPHLDEFEKKKSEKMSFFSRQSRLSVNVQVFYLAEVRVGVWVQRSADYKKRGRGDVTIRGGHWKHMQSPLEKM